MIKLFLVDDDSHILQGLLDHEFEECEYSIVGLVKLENDTFGQLKLIDVDIVLLNILNPEMTSIEYCMQVKEQFPKIKVIAFANNLTEKMLHEIWPQTVDAIVPKSIEKKELVNVIVGVMLGHRIVNKKISGFLDNGKPESENIPHLTRTEIEVLKLLGSGLRRKEVAHKLNRSYYSVELHCKNIFKKFNDHKMKSILEKVRKARIIK